MGRKHSRGDDDDALPPSQTQSRLPWGMEKTEMQPSSLAALTDDKLARFVLGHQKKTKFQKEREDREAKKRQADAEAAKIYATFVASFDNEDETKGKAFVRGETTQGKQIVRAGVNGDRPSGGDIYRLKGKEKLPFSGFEVSAVAAASGAGERSGKKMSEMDKMLQELKQKEGEHHSEQRQATHKPKKRRAIDEFLDEMKERGPAPISIESYSDGVTKGSFDNGDPETTNLYVGNLAPTVTEEVLQSEFGRFGDVYSVKIMWPRSEEERARRRNCGFVSFYERRDADEARINLNEMELEGQPMVVGWGKAVKIQPKARAPGVLLPSAVTPPPVLAPTTEVDVAGLQTITVAIPTDDRIRQRIDHLAQYVAADGLQFENAVRLRESNNRAEYAFMFDSQSAEGLYYRWRVYSFAMGDDKNYCREKPFQMTVNGPMWLPPPAPPRPQESRRRGSSSRSSGRHRRAEKSSRRDNNRSRSYSRSRSRSPDASPRRSRRRNRSRSRHWSRSRSTSSVDSQDYRRSRRRRSRSRSRGRHSRSWSSDDSESRSRRRRSRSCSRGENRRCSDSHHESARDSRRSSGHNTHNADHTEKLLTGQQIARARDVERGRERNRLSNDDYEDFKELLGELTLERESVKKTMGFALDNSEAAVDLVNIILESFKNASASSVTLVGLLYLTSDILHNSSAAVKNASLFRTTFQECLPEIMDVMRVSHRNIVGRMSANAMKEKVMNVLTAWESWSLFPPAVLVGFHATFLRKVEENDFIATYTQTIEGIAETDPERLRKTCRQAGLMTTGDVRQLIGRLQWLKEFTAPTITPGHGMSAKNPSRQSNINPVNADQPQNASEADTASSFAKSKVKSDDLDGEPIDEDLDGEPIDGEPISEADIDDLDGEPMDEDALDGEPLDADAAEDDLDGEPLYVDDLDGVPMDKEDFDGN